MELEEAAPEARDKVEDLEKEIEQSRQELSAAAGRLEKARERLDADGDAVIQAAQSFQESLTAQRTRLSHAVSETSRALGQLTEKVGGAHHEASTELSHAASAVAELEQRVHALEPDVDARYSQASAAATELDGFLDETGGQLEQALHVAGGLLGVASSDLDGMQDLVDRRVAVLGEFVSDAWAPVLADVGDAWASSVEAAVAAAVGAGVETASANLPEVLVAALEQSRQKHEEVITELGGLAERLVTVLGTLNQAVEDGTGLVVEHGSSGAQALRETAETVTRLEAGLQRVRALLAGYTFVQL